MDGAASEETPTGSFPAHSGRRRSSATAIGSGGAGAGLRLLPHGGRRGSSRGSLGEAPGSPRSPVGRGSPAGLTPRGGGLRAQVSSVPGAAAPPSLPAAAAEDPPSRAERRLLLLLRPRPAPARQPARRHCWRSRRAARHERRFRASRAAAQPLGPGRRRCGGSAGLGGGVAERHVARRVLGSCSPFAAGESPGSAAARPSRAASRQAGPARRWMAPRSLGGGGPGEGRGGEVAQPLPKSRPGKPPPRLPLQGGSRAAAAGLGRFRRLGRPLTAVRVVTAAGLLTGAGGACGPRGRFAPLRGRGCLDARAAGPASLEGRASERARGTPWRRLVRER